MSDDQFDGQRPRASHEVSNRAGGVSGNGTQVQAATIGAVHFHGGGSEAAAAGFGPFAPPPFVDREGPLARFRSVVEEGEEYATLLTVVAEPGGGASAFALKGLFDAYRRDRGRFPGGFFFVNLFRESTPVAVGELLRAAGVDERDVPATQEARVRRLRRTYANLVQEGRPFAVLVDSPATPYDLLPFVATGPGCLTVVATSGALDPRTLDPEGRALIRHTRKRGITLDGLPPADAERMFLAEAGVDPVTPRERAMVADFVAGADGNPGRIADLALDVAMRALGGDPDPLASAHRELVGPATVPGLGPRDRADLGGLPEELRGLAVALARLPDTDLGVGMVADVVERGADPARVRERLDALVAYRVLGPASEDTRRYRFVSAARRRSLAEHGAGGAGVLRAALTHYFGLVRAAHDVLLPHRWLQTDIDGSSAFPGAGLPADTGGGGRAAAAARVRGLLDPERRALRAVVLAAVEPDELRAAAELCEVAWAYWFTGGYFTDVVDTHSALLDRALGTPHVDPARLARLCVQSSIAHRRDGELARARDRAERAVELAEGTHPLAEYTAREALADAVWAGGDSAAAADRFAEALRAALDIEPRDDRALGIAERKLARARLELGRLDAAEELLIGALGRFRDDDHQNLARVRTVLGELRARQGCLAQALAEWERAVHHHTVLGDRRRVGDVYVVRANARAGSDPSAARADLEIALECYTDAEAVREAERVRARLAEGV
ncbi:tetratricopeptide repeat protein [Nocardiopsis sp. FIRDI 009]|uniref:tetratricopeptide repeat protein n=1 Tax=Nocardiopsis sp. FIRDI 009 TaxID=714197 RepID=UPI000E2247B3|nr:tetratricopeptide repeat protein [Nocardiopsis sp. FIRDI 009]